MKTDPWIRSHGAAFCPHCHELIALRPDEGVDKTCPSCGYPDETEDEGDEKPNLLIAG